MSVSEQRETYNGWSNYPTWAVNLWIDNDQGIQEATLEVVRDAMERSTFNVLSGKTTERYEVSSALKQWVTDEETGLVPDLGASVAGDLLGYALDGVDWYEIADAWIEVSS